MSGLTGFLKDQSGASAIEYAMIAIVVALLLAAAMPQVGTGVEDQLDTVSTKIK